MCSFFSIYKIFVISKCLLYVVFSKYVCYSGDFFAIYLLKIKNLIVPIFIMYVFQKRGTCKPHICFYYFYIFHNIFFQVFDMMCFYLVSDCWIFVMGRSQKMINNLCYFQYLNMLIKTWRVTWNTVLLLDSVATG